MSEEEGVLLTSEVAADGCGKDSMFDPGCAPFLPFENESIAVPREWNMCSFPKQKRCNRVVLLAPGIQEVACDNAAREDSILAIIRRETISQSECATSSK